MHLFLLDFNWAQLLNPEFYITNGGLWLFLFIVFAETGLFVGFFCPVIPCYLWPGYSATVWRNRFMIPDTIFQI